MNKTNQKSILYLAHGAMIAAVYAAATWLSALFGVAYGAVQFRLSEALTVLCVFTPAAIPGLTVGCILGNISSPCGVWDIVFGSLATLLAALCGRALRKFTVRGIPLLSVLTPVIFNAVFVGTETVFFLNPDAGLTGFLLCAAEVGLSEAAVCLLGGIPVFLAVRRAGIFKKQ